jgi:hypothetical protein
MPSAAARLVRIAPPMLAGLLLKASVTASTRCRTPLCSTAPRPSRPSTPSGGRPGHGVHAVDDDHRGGLRVEPLGLRGERADVVVPEPDRGAGAGRGAAVHAGVRVGVDQQRVVGPAHGRQQRQGGVAARRGEHRGLGA